MGASSSSSAGANATARTQPQLGTFTASSKAKKKKRTNFVQLFKDEGIPARDQFYANNNNLNKVLVYVHPRELSYLNNDVMAKVQSHYDKLCTLFSDLYPEQHYSDQQQQQQQHSKQQLVPCNFKFLKNNDEGDELEASLQPFQYWFKMVFPHAPEFFISQGCKVQVQSSSYCLANDNEYATYQCNLLLLNKSTNTWHLLQSSLTTSMANNNSGNASDCVAFAYAPLVEVKTYNYDTEIDLNYYERFNMDSLYLRFKINSNINSNSSTGTLAMDSLDQLKFMLEAMNLYNSNNSNKSNNRYIDIATRVTRPHSVEKFRNLNTIHVTNLSCEYQHTKEVTVSSLSYKIENRMIEISNEASTIQIEHLSFSGGYIISGYVVIKQQQNHQQIQTSKSSNSNSGNSGDVLQVHMYGTSNNDNTISNEQFKLTCLNKQVNLHVIHGYLNMFGLARLEQQVTSTLPLDLFQDFEWSIECRNINVNSEQELNHHQQEEQSLKLVKPANEKEVATNMYCEQGMLRLDLVNLTVKKCNVKFKQDQCTVYDFATASLNFYHEQPNPMHMLRVMLISTKKALPLQSLLEELELKCPPAVLMHIKQQQQQQQLIEPIVTYVRGSLNLVQQDLSIYGTMKQLQLNFELKVSYAMRRATIEMSRMVAQQQTEDASPAIPTKSAVFNLDYNYCSTFKLRRFKLLPIKQLSDVVIITE